MNEIWRDIEGYEGLYEISDCGRVRSYPRLVKCGKSGHRMMGGKILTPGKQPSTYRSYLYVTLCDRQSCKKNYLIHRLVATAFISNPENKPQVNHKDGDPSNNHVTNLEWVTSSENGLHAYCIGLNTPRSNEHIRKMVRNSVEVRRIKVRCIETGQVFDSLASAGAYFGICPESVRNSEKFNRAVKGYSFELV